MLRSSHHLPPLGLIRPSVPPLPNNLTRHGHQRGGIDRMTEIYHGVSVFSAATGVRGKDYPVDGGAKKAGGLVGRIRFLWNL